jgi:DNA-binding MarR family transcriptional regulator
MRKMTAEPPPPTRRSAPVPADDVAATLDALRRIVQALRIAGRESERRVGLSAAQLFALQRVAENPGASINDIAARTFTHQSSVSVVLQRLVDQRLVVKVPVVSDRRRQALELTAKGRRVLPRAPAAVQHRLIVALSTLPAADRRRLARSLDRLARSVTPAGVDQAPMLFEDPHRRARRGGSGRRKAHSR